MSKYKILTELSEKSFEDLEKKIKLISENIPELEKIFLLISLVWLEKKAKLNVRESVGKTGYIPTGELEEGFQKYANANLGILKNECPYSAYVEYGTGIRGKNNPHPDVDIIGYAYDVNSHGEIGWIYYDSKKNTHWTQGLSAHRFMYNALNSFLYQGGIGECMDKTFKSFLGVIL